MRRTSVLATMLAGLVAMPAMAADVMVFCPGAVQSVVRELVKSYEQKTGNTVKFEYGTAGALAKRVAAGASGDVVTATDAGSCRARQVGQGQRREHPRSRQHGRRCRRQAPARRGRTSTTLTRSRSRCWPRVPSCTPTHPRRPERHSHREVFAADSASTRQIASKLQLRDRGPDGLKEVASGDIEIGLGQISEILANKDVVLVGPFPRGDPRRGDVLGRDARRVEGQESGAQN